MALGNHTAEWAILMPAKIDVMFTSSEFLKIGPGTFEAGVYEYKVLPRTWLGFCDAKPGCSPSKQSLVPRSLKTRRTSPVIRTTQLLKNWSPTILPTLSNWRLNISVRIDWLVPCTGTWYVSNLLLLPFQDTYFPLPPFLWFSYCGVHILPPTQSGRSSAHVWYYRHDTHFLQDSAAASTSLVQNVLAEFPTLDQTLNHIQ